MKKLLKNTLRGRCTYFFFRFSPEKIPSHNTVYLARSCPRSTHICQKLIDFQRNFGKHQIYWNVVIWDKYQNSEWIPLWFWCMTEAQKVWFKLKSIIVKNMENNRWKAWTGWIWKYRALNSDYYLFKHEYILVFKKR
jgi:hypothetical protein